MRALIVSVASWLDLTRISAISRIVATLFSNALSASSASFTASPTGEPALLGTHHLRGLLHVSWSNFHWSPGIKTAAPTPSGRRLVALDHMAMPIRLTDAHGSNALFSPRFIIVHQKKHDAGARAASGDRARWRRH